MHKLLTAIARGIAGICAILFVVTTILALLLTTLDRQAFNSTLYKHALQEQNFYEHLPELVGLALTSSSLTDPCAKNPLACNIDGASPELQACLTTALGSDAYQAIGSGQRSPSAEELQLAQACLDQFGTGQAANSQSESGSSGGGGMPPFLQNLKASDWKVILTILLPPAELKTMAERTLDQLFAYLNGQTDTVTVALDKLKGRLAGQAGLDLITQLINSQPPCTVQLLADLATGTNNGGLPLCKPPEQVLPILIPLIQSQLNAVVTKLPDQVTILKAPTAGTLPRGSGPFGADLISTLRSVRWILRLSPLVPLGFLLLVTIFAVRSFKSWLRWWGIPIFISGVLALPLALLALPGLNMAWTLFIVPRIPPIFPAEVAAIGLELVRSIVHSISTSLIIQSIILFVIGLAAWIGSSFVKTKNQTKKPLATETPAS
jgi:hypothetical protein